MYNLWVICQAMSWRVFSACLKVAHPSVTSWNVTSSGKASLGWLWCFWQADVSLQRMHDCDPLSKAGDTVVVDQFLMICGLRALQGLKGSSVFTHMHLVPTSDLLKRWISVCLAAETLKSFYCITIWWQKPSWIFLLPTSASLLPVFWTPIKTY